MDENELRELMGGLTPEERAAQSSIAFESGDYRRYVLLMHGRDRLVRFREVEDRVDDSIYWSLLAEVYVSIERPGGEIFDLLRSTRPQRELFMTEDERQAFAALPEVLTLWRGDTRRDEPGWAWTLEQEQAEWFARQRERTYGDAARVRTATAAKKDAVGYLTRRDEAEIVIDPDCLHDVRERPIVMAPFEVS